MCGTMDIECHVTHAVQSMATGWADYGNQVSAEFFSTALNSLSTFWVKSETPVTLATQDGQTWTNSDPVAFLHDKTLPLTLSIFTVAILVAGLRMAWEQRA